MLATEIQVRQARVSLESQRQFFQAVISDTVIGEVQYFQGAIVRQT
jgi:hypothetical protein